MTTRFIALDVETANCTLSSICQIGIATYENGQLIGQLESFINPNTYFDQNVINVHGIYESDVKDAPSFKEIYPYLENELSNEIVVSHTHFDRTAMKQVAEANDLPELNIRWLDSSKVARRTWDAVKYKGYNLRNLCDMIGFDFTHHNALEDAHAAAHVLLSAIEETNIGVEEWFIKQQNPISSTNISGDVKLDGNPEGILYGGNIVFTGALDIPRREAAAMAAKAGLNVDKGVTKQTTVLCVGDQDLRVLNGQTKSGKHRKAEKYISEGQRIRIICESDFKMLMELEH